MHAAILYEKLPARKVRCRLCRHGCIIRPGQTGLCGVRTNEGGALYSLVYDRVAAAAVDPIEKKPLFHFYPGSLAFSIATMGCNFACLHCQNAGLSKAPRDAGVIDGQPIPPAALAARAEEQGCRSLSFTYTEPTVFAELALETARIAHARGIATNFVTNGYQSPEMVAEMTGLIDAANVDLKSFSSAFYKDVCGAKLEEVLDTIQRMHAAGLWIEITTLVIPGRNDSDAELRSIAAFIRALSPDVPWHVTRFHPAYRMTQHPATPAASLFRAKEIGREEGLRYVYTGNIPGLGGEDTHCPQCDALLVERAGFYVRGNQIAGGRCPHCHAVIAGVFES